MVAGGGSGGVFNVPGCPGGESKNIQLNTDVLTVKYYEFKNHYDPFLYYLDKYSDYDLFIESSITGRADGTGTNMPEKDGYIGNGGGGGYYGGICFQQGSQYNYYLYYACQGGSSYVSGHPLSSNHSSGVTFEDPEMTMDYNEGDGEFYIKMIYVCPDHCIVCEDNKCTKCESGYYEKNFKCIEIPTNDFTLSSAFATFESSGISHMPEASLFSKSFAFTYSQHFTSSQTFSESSSSNFFTFQFDSSLEDTSSSIESDSYEMEDSIVSNDSYSEEKIRSDNDESSDKCSNSEVIVHSEDEYSSGESNSVEIESLFENKNQSNYSNSYEIINSNEVENTISDSNNDGSSTSETNSEDIYYFSNEIFETNAQYSPTTLFTQLIAQTIIKPESQTELQIDTRSSSNTQAKEPTESIEQSSSSQIKDSVEINSID